jgi:hypothetical protein
LYQFFVFFILEPLIRGESIIAIEIGVADLVDNIFADNIDRGCNLIFDEIEVAVYGFLKQSALGLDAAIHCVFFHKRDDLILGQKNSWSHMVVVFFHADVATCCLLPNATVGCAESCYLLTVLTLIHYNKSNYIYSNRFAYYR